MIRATFTFGLVLTLITGAGAQMLLLSQNVDPLNAESTSNTCNPFPGIFQPDGAYLRFFDLVAEGETSPFITIRRVLYGVQLANNLPGTTQPLFINFYEVPTGTTAYSGFSLLGSELVNLPVVSSPDVRSHTLASPLVYAQDPSFDLVVEVFSPAKLVPGLVFVMGSNDDGQTAPGYFAAAACGFPDPTDAVSLDPDMDIIISLLYERGDTLPDFPGTQYAFGDDIAQRYDVNGTGNLVAVAPPDDAVSVNAGDTMELEYSSPGGMLAGVGDYLAIGSLVTTGTNVPEPFPNLFVGATVILVDGLVSILGSPATLPLAGSSVSFIVPPGLAGFDLVTQGIVLSSLAANNIFASTNGLTIAFN